MTLSTAPSRIVIDTNVWISALVFGGMPRQVFELALQQGTAIIASEAIFTEARRILNRKFPDFVDDFETLIPALGSTLHVVPLGTITVSASCDPDDNAIIETALVAQAPVVISGDKDLLGLETYQSVTFLTPKSYYEHSVGPPAARPS